MKKGEKVLWSPSADQEWQIQIKSANGNVKLEKKTWWWYSKLDSYVVENGGKILSMGSLPYKKTYRLENVGDGSVTFRVSKSFVYTVIFKDYDGKVLKEAKVQNHESVAPPANPSREGYNFVGWSNGGYEDVTQDMEIMAQYKEIILEVSEKLITLLKSYETGCDENDNLLPLGEPALAPYLDIAGHRTIGWGYKVANKGDTAPKWMTFKSGAKKDLNNPKTRIELVEAEELFKNTREKFQSEFNQILKEFGTSLNQYEYDAFFMLGYNVGIEKFKSDTNIREYLKANQFGKKIDVGEFTLQIGDYTSGLKYYAMIRRLDEIEIVLYHDYERQEGGLLRMGDIFTKKTYPYRSNMTVLLELEKEKEKK